MVKYCFAADTRAYYVYLSVCLSHSWAVQWSPKFTIYYFTAWQSSTL